MLSLRSSSPLRPDSKGMDAEDILDLDVRKTVVALTKAFPTHEFQTCYYSYVYEDYSYDAAVRRLETVPPKLQDINESLQSRSKEDNVSADVVTNVGVLPAEIWQIVCQHLAYEDLATLRLTSSGLADIAAEFVVSRIRVDTSFESLKRLKNIANNKCLRKNVKNLTFEGALLVDIGCIHAYMEHFEMEHHLVDKPKPPEGKDLARSKALARALRLYNRNMTKWQKSLEEKYKHYRKRYESQQLLLKGPKAHLFECLNNFPNLKTVVLRSDVPCQHMLSERFKEMYCRDCAIPLSIDSTQTTWQLEHILRPGIKSLSARILSPNFFKFNSQDWLNTMFRELEVVSITLRPENDTPGGMTTDRETNLGEGGQMVLALKTCLNLKSICVNLHTQGGTEFRMNLDEMFPANHVFAKLSNLDLDYFTTSEDKLLDALKRQPLLSSLGIACSRLTQGDWPSVVYRMRKDLKLTDLYCYGYLEDGDLFYPMDLCDKDAWSDGQRITLGFSVCCYVTDHDYPDMQESGYSDGEHDALFNPLRCMDDDYEDDTELSKIYGPLSDSEGDHLDDDDDNDSDDNGSDIDSDHDTDMDSSSSMPPLGDAMEID